MLFVSDTLTCNVDDDRTLYQCYEDEPTQGTTKELEILDGIDVVESKNQMILTLKYPGDKIGCFLWSATPRFDQSDKMICAGLDSIHYKDKEIPLKRLKRRI